MQNNKKSNRFLSFVKDKGYYIVLLLCAVAVGVSGYLLLSTPKEKPADDISLSATTPSGNSTSPTKTSPKASTADAIATEGEEPTVASEGNQAEKLPKKMQVVPPVEGEQVTAFAADYLAYNTTTKDWRTHEGVDLAAELGQKVVAAADGTVYTIYEDESFGMSVVLRHDNGYTTHYSNLSEEVLVTVGQKVSAGTEIGTVGQTAGIETATASHLHFAVFQNSKAIDPMEFLNQA